MPHHAELDLEAIEVPLSQSYLSNLKKEKRELESKLKGLETNPSPDAIHSTVETQMKLAPILKSLGDIEGAYQHLATAHALSMRDDLTPDANIQAGLLLEMGKLAHAAGHIEDARQQLVESLTLRRALRHATPTDLHASLMALASLCIETENLADAKSLYAEALEVGKTSYGPDRDFLTASSLQGLASLEQVDGELAQAELYLRDAVNLLENHGKSGAQASIKHCLAELLISCERPEEAIDLLQETLEMEQELYADCPDFTVAFTEISLGGLLLQSNRALEALPLLARAEQRLSVGLGPTHALTQQATHLYSLCRTSMAEPEQNPISPWILHAITVTGGLPIRIDALKSLTFRIVLGHRLDDPDLRDYLQRLDLHSHHPGTLTDNPANLEPPAQMSVEQAAQWQALIRQLVELHQQVDRDFETIIPQLPQHENYIDTQVFTSPRADITAQWALVDHALTQLTRARHLGRTEDLLKSQKLLHHATNIALQLAPTQQGPVLVQLLCHAFPEEQARWLQEWTQALPSKYLAHLTQIE